MSGWKRPLGHPDQWDFEPVMISWSETKTSEENLDNYIDLDA
jgi:hypothetical protein